MTGDINTKLARLLRIRSIATVDPSLEQLLQEQRHDEANAAVDAIFEQIRVLTQLSSEGKGTPLYRPLEGRLTAEQYVLPPELAEVHPQLLQDLRSGSPIEHFPFGGLLLYGEAVGTGKTEYAKFLAYELGESAVVVDVNISAIRDHPEPATVLRNLFRQLEKRATQEGTTYVAVFDEFDKLVNKYSLEHSHSLETSSERSSEKRASSHSHRETKETRQIDDVGEGLFSTLKNIVSGTEEIHHVYMIATSNQATYPDALLRRLQPVELRAFGIPEFTFGRGLYHQAADYGGYTERLPRMVRVLQATHRRLNEGNENAHLRQIHGELSPMLEALREEYGIDFDLQRQAGEALLMKGDPQQRIGEAAIRSNAYLFALLKYFGCDLKEETAGVGEGVYRRKKILKFAGQFREPVKHKERGSMPPFEEEEVFVVQQEGVFSSGYSGQPPETSPDVHFMRGLTPSQLAITYKRNRAAFTTYDTAKQFIGELVFPQLKVLRQFKAASSG